MNIYLMRHGIAEERSDPSMEVDAGRELTEEGREKVKRITKGLIKLGVKPDLIVSSPYTRAEQTARIAAKEFEMEKKLRFSELLKPEGKPEAILEAIPREYKVDELMLVGHYPSLGWLMAAFLGADPGERLLLRKGGVCLFNAVNLQIEQRATLEWLLTPKLLMKV